MGVSVAVHILLVTVSLASRFVVQAKDLRKLDEALPRNVNVTYIYPVFDFDTDSCFPSAGIGRDGKLNSGIKASGGVTGACRSGRFMDLSNTYHRYACVHKKSTEYCGHSFALYMLKDQVGSWLMSGHRHDWEHVVVWTEDGIMERVTCSRKTYPDVEIPTQDGHPKIVYHKPGSQHHRFRVAKTDEPPENPYGRFMTPTIASWFTMKGDGVSNEQLRTSLSKSWFGRMTAFPHADSVFLETLNDLKPEWFPAFTQESIDKSQ